jgi:hypothetical protein
MPSHALILATAILFASASGWCLRTAFSSPGARWWPGTAAFLLGLAIMLAVIAVTGAP